MANPFKDDLPEGLEPMSDVVLDRFGGGDG